MQRPAARLPPRDPRPRSTTHPDGRAANAAHRPPAALGDTSPALALDPAQSSNRSQRDHARTALRHPATEFTQPRDQPPRGAAGGAHHRTLTTARAHLVNPLTGVRPYRALTGLRAREPGRPWTPPTAPPPSPHANGAIYAPRSTRRSASGSPRLGRRAPNAEPTSTAQRAAQPTAARPAPTASTGDEHAASSGAPSAENGQEPPASAETPAASTRPPRRSRSRDNHRNTSRPPPNASDATAAHTPSAAHQCTTDHAPRSQLAPCHDATHPPRQPTTSNRHDVYVIGHFRW
jgi:hypothetical protein